MVLSLCQQHAKYRLEFGWLNKLAPTQTNKISPLCWFGLVWFNSLKTNKKKIISSATPHTLAKLNGIRAVKQPSRV